MSRKNIAVRALLLFSLLIGSSFSAFAATCSVSDVSSSQECIGEITNPVVDSTNWFNTYGTTGAFGSDQWFFAEKRPIESPGDQVIDLGLSITPTIDGEGKFGTWSLNSTVFDDYLKVALVFKAGQGFSAYLLDGTATTGTWDITGWTRSGLSHASVYAVSAIPIPAAVWLFGSGLIGLIGFSRRKKI